MKVFVGKSTQEMAQAAADNVANAIREAIKERGEARIIVATGASQFDFLKALIAAPGIDWTKVTGFHLDEYVGLPIAHRASFRSYLRERFVQALPTPPQAFVEVNGEVSDLAAECRRLHELINVAPIDVACVGIGENAHLAFNDPPADFDTEDAYIVVDLDEACRQQQVGEGWFENIHDMPQQAISMSIKQIMKSRCIVCTVPDARKAKAVSDTLNSEISNMIPASIMRRHGNCTIFLDPASAAKLECQGTEVSGR